MKNPMLISKKVYHVCYRRLHSRVRQEYEMEFDRLQSLVVGRRVQDPHPGLIISTVDFKESYPVVEEISLLSIATMDLLNSYIYPSTPGYTKFTITLKMRKDCGLVVPFTIGNAIVLTNEAGTHHLTKKDIYKLVAKIFHDNAARYNGACLLQLTVRAYLDRVEVKDHPSLTVDARLQEVLKTVDSEPLCGQRKEG